MNCKNCGIIMIDTIDKQKICSKKKTTLVKEKSGESQINIEYSEYAVKYMCEFCGSTNADKEIKFDSVSIKRNW